MGLQGKELGMETANGASVMVIDQACDNDQLLVSLSKNGAQWLSPVGWTDQQKVTLLDCRPNGDTTEIDIPAEFASDIKTGDVLVLRCSELDLEKEIIWETSEVATRSTEDIASTTTSLAGGLLSRFKGTKTEVQEETKSEAQLRAEEADRAAQSYKAKMEAAAAAKEDAQRKALDAAREAEAALKMEAERIAEMERAAKAFEEAERLKQDELRRVEEERRAEEARLAEEARRVEEARLREIAAKKEAKRKEALERYEAGLDITRNEEVRLKNRLKDLKRQAKSDAANLAVQEEDLQSRLGLLVTGEETTAKRFETYDKSASKLDEVTKDLTQLKEESDSLSADHQALSIRLSQVDSAYEQAQKEAEAAMAKAEARREELDILRQEEGDISGKILSVNEKLSAQSQTVAQMSEKTQKLQSKLEMAQAELAQAKVEVEALEQVLAVQAEQEQNLRLEIEATQQAVEDSQARETAHLEAIEHLQAGGAPEDITDVDFEALSFEATSFTSVSADVELSAEKMGNLGLKGRMLGRVRRSFSREKDAEISIDVEDVILDAGEKRANSVLIAELDDTPGFVRRHSSSLMALAVVIGGIAILGGGLALNKSAKPKLEVKSRTPAPTQVASAVSKVERPKISDIKILEAEKATSEKKGDEIVAESNPLPFDLPKIEVSDITPVKTEIVKDEAIETESEISPKVEESKSEMEDVVKDSMTAAETENDSFIVKLAEVVDPTGFAFELPDMQPVAVSNTATAEATPKKATAIQPVKKKPTPKKTENKKSDAAKTAAITKLSAQPAPRVEADVNYPELTSDIQTRLVTLGFYNGEIDGLQGKSTRDAITTFKTVYSMSETSGKITGALLTELKRAEREQEAANLQAQAVAEAERIAQAELESQASIQVAEVAPSITLYDTVQAVPSTPVITDSLPSAEEFTPVIESEPVSVTPEPEVVKVASIPSIVSESAPTPVAQDVIVEAKILKNASAKYPSAAQRRDYFVNVAIVVGYDIDASGRASNIRIESNDYSGRFNEAFEKEAKNAIKKLRYEPKTVNGVAVESAGKQKRIVFRSE